MNPFHYVYNPSNQHPVFLQNLFQDHDHPRVILNPGGQEPPLNLHDRFADLQPYLQPINWPPIELQPIELPPIELQPITINRDRLGELFRVSLDDDKPIPENSWLRKLCACIPILGIGVAIWNERSLQKKIQNAYRSIQINRTFKLIQIKNHYKICSIIRVVLTVALVASVSFSLLSSGLALGLVSGSMFIGSCCISLYAYNLYKNKQLTHQKIMNYRVSSELFVR